MKYYAIKGHMANEQGIDYYSESLAEWYFLQVENFEEALEELRRNGSPPTYDSSHWFVYDSVKDFKTLEDLLEFKEETKLVNI